MPAQIITDQSRTGKGSKTGHRAGEPGDWKEVTLPDGRKSATRDGSRKGAKYLRNCDRVGCVP